MDHSLIEKTSPPPGISFMDPGALAILERKARGKDEPPFAPGAVGVRLDIRSPLRGVLFLAGTAAFGWIAVRDILSGYAPMSYAGNLSLALLFLAGGAMSLWKGMWLVFEPADCRTLDSGECSPERPENRSSGAAPGSRRMAGAIGRIRWYHRFLVFRERRSFPVADITGVEVNAYREKGIVHSVIVEQNGVPTRIFGHAGRRAAAMAEWVAAALSRPAGVTTTHTGE